MAITRRRSDIVNPNMLLTQEEAEKAVDEWASQDWSTRIIQLNRGHWEAIVLVVAQAQLDKLKRLRILHD